MKHVFYVHSAITYLVAMRVIAYEQLQPNECVLLLSRGFIPPASNTVQVRVFPFVNYPNSSFAVTWRVWSLWHKIDTLDRLLDEATHAQPFVLYVPHAAMTYFYLMVSHPLCRGYSFIEEGTLSYYPPHHSLSRNTNVWWKRWAYWFLYKQRGVPPVKPFFRLDLPTYRHAYGMTEHTFPQFGGRRTIGLVFSPQIGLYPANIHHVLVFDALVEYGIVPIHTVQYALTQLMQYLQHTHPSSTLHIKFHPEQHRQPQAKAQWLAFFAQYPAVSIEELATTVVLEDLAASCPTCTFYVWVSSVGLYAALAGNPVYSLAGYVADQYPQFQHTLHSLPPIYKKQIPMGLPSS